MAHLNISVLAQVSTGHVDATVVLTLVVIIIFLFLIIGGLIRSLRRARRAQAILLAQIQEHPVKNASEPTQKSEIMPRVDEETKEMESDKPLYGRLIVLSGLREPEILMYSETFVIGRTPGDGCDYVIDKPYISPKHCVIMKKDGGYSIRDLGSKNGTFVNGDRVQKDQETVVPIGSEVEITRNIVLELWGPDTVIDLQSHPDYVSKTSHGEDEGELVFKPLLDIDYVGDIEGEIGDDYSPI